MSGYLGRVVGGASAAGAAWLLRLLWNGSRKLGRSIKNTYRRPAAPAAPQQSQGQGQGQQQAAGQTNGAGQQATPNPAPNPTPNPAPSRTRNPAPAGNPTPAGTPAGTSTGGTPVSAAYPGYAHAVDFFASAAKWSPGSHSGAIWELEAALPLMRDSIYSVTNGYAKTVANCERDLQGGLHAHMRGALADVWNGLHGASQAAGRLPKAFNDAYADRIAVRNVRGGQTTNV